MHRKIVSAGRQVISNPLFGGSAVMLVGSQSANFLAMLYHFILAPALGKVSYGELAALLSLVALISSTYTFSGTVIIKYVSSSSDTEVGDILHWFSKKAIQLGLVGSLFLLLLSPLLARNLHMPLPVILLVVPISFMGLISFVYRSFLQGMLLFVKSVLLSNLEMAVRLAVSVGLVLLGFRVLGAAFGILVSLIVSFLLCRHYLRNFISTTPTKDFHPGESIFKYSFAVLLFTLANTSFYSSDLLIVKHFFQADQAGIFAAAATLGKIVLFASGPIGSVMFPMVSKRYASGQNFKKLFLISLFMTLTLCIAIAIGFLFFAPLAVRLLYGTAFADASVYIFPYAIFIMFFTLASLIANYYLSQGKTVVVVYTVLAAVIQVITMLLFHDSLFQIIHASSIAAGLLFVTLLMYFLLDKASLNKALLVKTKNEKQNI